MSTPESQIPTQTGTLSVPEFAARIKQKYPEYQSLDDHELTGRILAKYSMYAPKVKFADDDEATKVTEIRVNAARGTRDAAVNSLLPNSPPQSLSSDVGSRLVPAQEQIEPAQTRPRTVTPQPTPETATVTAPTQPSVPLNPLIQKRLDVAQQSRKQQEMQARVQQARDARAKARPAPPQAQSLAGTDLGNLLLTSRAQSRGQAQPNLTASPHQQRPLASKFASAPQRSVHQRQAPSLTDQAKSMVAKEVADYYGGQPFEQDLTSVGEGIGSAVASTGRQAVNAADLAMKYGPGNVSRLIPMVRRQQDEAIAKGREGVGKLEQGVEASETTHPAEGGLDEFRQGLERGAGSAAIELPKLMAGGELLGAANLPIQGALSREEEGLPGLIKGAAGGLVYHYGMGFTGKAIGKLGNALFWTAAPTAQGMASGQSFGKALGEALPMGALAGMGGEKEPVQVREGESVRPATVDDLPKIASKDLEVVPPERTGLVTPFGRKAPQDSPLRQQVNAIADSLAEPQAQRGVQVRKGTPNETARTNGVGGLSPTDPRQLVRPEDIQVSQPGVEPQRPGESNLQDASGVQPMVPAAISGAGQARSLADDENAGQNQSAPIVGFTTAKGSTYTVRDNRTIRNKSFHPEHGAQDIGIKPQSQATYYVSPEDAIKLGEIQTQGPEKTLTRWLGADGKYHIGLRYEEGPDAGKVEKRTVVSYDTVPSIGETPIEIWNSGKGSKNVHFGNEITALQYAEPVVPRETPQVAPEEPNNQEVDTKPPQVGEVSNKEVSPMGDVKEPWQMTREEWADAEGVDLDPPYIYHGTPMENLESIRKRGLQSVSRERNDYEEGDRGPREQELLYFERGENRNWGGKKSAQLRINEDMLPSGVSLDEDQLRPGEYYASHHRNEAFEIPPEAIDSYNDETKRWENLVYDDHYDEVKRALAEGKPVPPEVLADYPDLQTTASSPSERQESVTPVSTNGLQSDPLSQIGAPEEHHSNFQPRTDSGQFDGPPIKEQPNAIDQGIEQGRDEAKLPGVREGEDLQAHPEQVRPGASNEAENSGSAKTSGQEQPEVKDRSLPKNLEAAQMEKGENTKYEPISLSESETAGRQMLKDKGVDGVIEHVLHGPPTHEIAPAAFAALNEMVRQEKVAREGSDLEAEAAINAKRRQFAGDLAERFTELGQTINAVKTIENFAPDKALYLANKLSMKVRKRGLSAEEDARIGREGEENAAHIEALKTIDAGLKERARILDERENAVSERESKLTDAEKSQGKTEPKAKPEKPKTDYKSRLKAQSDQAKATLKVNLGKLNFGKLTVPVGEKGAVRVGIPALEGDAELLAQYAAGRLGELDNVEQLNKELIGEFGPEVEPHLPEIRQRAYQIRKDARIAELEAAGTKPNRRKTILSEIQNEIGQARKAAKAADTAEAKQREQKEASIRNVESFTAKAEARKAREQEQKAKQATAKEARQRLAQARQEYQEADKAEKKGYRASIKQQRDFERTAKLWDTPIRNAAKDARTRLANATDSKAPETISDLTAVMAEKMLPEEIGGSPRKGGKSPAALYTELKQEFPNLATDKNKSQVFKQAYEQVDTMAKAAREASRLRGASAESKKLWEQSGMDIDTQALLIQRAARTQKLLESNKRLAREFERVSQSRFKKVTNEVLAAPRALQTALNFHIGRQGLFYLVTHPLAVSKGAVGATLKGYAALKPEQYVRAVEELQNHPDYDLGKKAGLNVAELPSDVGGNLSQAVEEDLLQSTWASKLPHVRLSQQGFALGMNTERVNAFSLYAKAGKMAGYTFENNPEFFKQAASVVNDATGRGSMPKAIESMAGITNKLFYATRLNVSRVKLLNDLFNPIKYQQYDPVMRKIMVKETARLVAGMAAMYGAAHMLGLKTSADPDDPDFGKVVWGTHHYDISGGEAQNIRFAFRFMRGIKNLVEGEKQPENQDPLTLAGHFARGKLAPLPGAAMDYLYGKDVIGHPANLKIQSPGKMINENIMARMLVPLVIKDYAEAYQEDGWGGVAKTTPVTAGFGVQDYAETGVKALKNAPVAKELKRLNVTHLSDSTKDEKLDADINQRVTERVEAMKAPEGTDVGREKMLRDKLEQARTLSKAESALADPKRYGDYLKSQKTAESMSFLTDEEKSRLTDDDLKRYRSAYVDSYLSLLQKVASGDAYKAMDDDKKEKALGRISAVAATTAKRQALQERRK